MNNCIICNSQKIRIFFSLTELVNADSSWGVPSSKQTIYKCNSCGLHFTDRTVTKEQEILMYGESYHKLMNGTVNQVKYSGIISQIVVRLNMIKQYVNKGKLLDVGCSTGFFILEAKKVGFNVLGIDPSEYACNEAIEKIGPDYVYQEDIETSLLLKKEKFDIITLWDVIEHCNKPKENIKKIINALNPDGIIVIRTPNVNSIFFCLARILWYLSFGLIKYPIISLYHSDHFVFLSKKSLKLLLSGLDMKIYKIISDPLLWNRFKYCECNRTILYNFGISILYWIGRMFGHGHGLIAIAGKWNEK